MLAEQRQAPRKVLRVKAMWLPDGAAAVAARTLDVGSNGISLSLSEPVGIGLHGRISFEMYFDGQAHMIMARASVAHCIFSSGCFKVGFHFSNLELSAATAIAKFMR